MTVQVSQYLKRFNTGLFLFGGPQTKQQCAPLELLPGEILLEIAESLPCSTDKLAFGMTVSVAPLTTARRADALPQSRLVYPVVQSALYASVKLQGFAQCRDTLTMLRDTPDLARHVQELELHPDYVSDRWVAGYEESARMCEVVSLLVVESIQHMDALRTFTWNALAALPQESMWTELRHRCVCLVLSSASDSHRELCCSCPMLKNIGTSFVHLMPSPMSDVCAVRDI